MLHSNNPIIKHKTGLLNLADELGNESQDCRIMGLSRDTFIDTKKHLNKAVLMLYSILTATFRIIKIELMSKHKILLSIMLLIFLPWANKSK